MQTCRLDSIVPLFVFFVFFGRDVVVVYRKQMFPVFLAFWGFLKLAAAL